MLLMLLLTGCTTRSASAPETSPTPGPTADTVITAGDAVITAGDALLPPEAIFPPAEMTPEPSEEPQAEPEEPGVFYNPLTGEVSDRDYGAARPVAVMVENNYWTPSDMITQSGISQAAIVYEMEVEKTTRNMAIFTDIDQVGEIMPIRSARSYFVSAALAYDAIYVRRGASSAGRELASTFLQYYTDNDDIDLDNGYVNSYRYDDSEHALATSGQLLTDWFASVGTRMEHKSDNYDYGLHFTENAAPTHGDAANSIRIVFPEMKITSFTYSAEKNGYAGFQWNGDWIDKNSGETVVFQNVLVLCTDIEVGIDRQWHSAMTTVNYEGKGFFCNGGYCEPITWSRGNYTTPFRYYDAEGNELELGVGHTYIAFISDEGYVSFP